MRIRPLDMQNDKMITVCGTDFSMHAKEAADVAAMLAQRFGDSLTLIHVNENQGMAADSPEIHQAFLLSSTKKLHDEAERLRKLGATVKEELLTGAPYEKLVDAGRHSSTRLTVVSSLGWIAPSQFFLGSVAERTAEHSQSPTLIVRGSDAFAAWIRGERPLKIVACYDLSESSDSTLRWINELCGIGPCEVTVAYVAWPPRESGRFGIVNRPSPAAISPETQTLLERDLKLKAGAVLGDKKVHIRILASWGRADFPLINLASDFKADLIVVGAHQREGLNRFRLGSVSRTVLRHAPTSVAVVPLKAAIHGTQRLPEFKCVLATTDFSEIGNRAIPYAYSALPHGGIVCLLHIIPPSGKSGQSSSQTDSLKRTLRDLIPAEAESRGIETQVLVVEHQAPSTAICQAAERLGADLICLASHGHSGLAKTFLGSVAQAVMTHSTRPLLLLRATNP